MEYSVLETIDLKKSFGKNEILKGISEKIGKKEVVAIIGPSGSGKSTFLRSLNLLEKPTSGKVLLDGIDLEGKDVDIYKMREKIGMVFQHFNLFNNLTVMENLILAPMKVDKKSKEEATLIAKKFLKKVNLLDRQNHYPSELSGGQKQRIAIARALCMMPEVILLDEPTSALDPANVGEVLLTIKSLALDGITLVIATHEMAFAKEVATRVLFMEGGRIVEQGTPKEIFENPKEEKTKNFLSKII